MIRRSFTAACLLGVACDLSDLTDGRAGGGGSGAAGDAGASGPGPGGASIGGAGGSGAQGGAGGEGGACEVESPFTWLLELGNATSQAIHTTDLLGVVASSIRVAGVPEPLGGGFVLAIVTEGPSPFDGTGDGRTLYLARYSSGGTLEEVRAHPQPPGGGEHVFVLSDLFVDEGGGRALPGPHLRDLRPPRRLRLLRRRARSCGDPLTATFTSGRPCSRRRAS